MSKNKNITIIVLAVALIIIGGLYLSERYGKIVIDTSVQESNSATGQGTETGTNSGAGTGTSTSGQDSNDATGTTGVTKYLYIEGFNFYSALATANVGDTIVWENNDNTPHTVTSDSGTELDSEYLSRRDTYSHTFTEPGEYSYHCKSHPSMKGKVIVQ